MSCLAGFGNQRSLNFKLEYFLRKLFFTDNFIHRRIYFVLLYSCTTADPLKTKSQQNRHKVKLFILKDAKMHYKSSK